MPQWSRRKTLQFGAPLVLAFTTGCSGDRTNTPPPNRTTENSKTPSPTTTPTPSYGIGTPASGECEINQPLYPDPTEELEPKSYPQYPGDITEKTVVTFVKEYESVFQYNTILAEDQPTYDEILIDVSAPSWAHFEHKNGFIVGVDVETRIADVTTPTASPTPAPTSLITNSTWYYLAPEVARRKQFEKDLGDSAWPDFGTSDIIYCGANGTE